MPTCSNIVEIMFVVDSSGSLRGYFDAEKYFVKSLAESFDISEGNSRVGFVRFSHIVQTEIGLTNFTDMHKFHDAVNNIFYDGGLTRIDLGLRNAEIEFNKPQNKARLDDANASQIVMLITDGRQGEDDPNPAIIARRMRSQGIKLVVIGVGKIIDEVQMQELAGAGNVWHKTISFDDLINVHNIEKLKEIICHMNGNAETSDNQ